MAAAAVMGSDECQVQKEDGSNSSSNGSTVVTATTTSGTNDQTSSEGQRCFVCDVRVQGRHYALATCRTQSSRSRVIEKLGELVGERYMVVISEDDVICRGCANLMNTLDRLESEMRGVKEAILRFLERKYSLDDGELLGNNDMTKPCQPPQITKSTLQNGDGYHARKRAAVFSSETKSDGAKQKKSNVWMQCDKCRYTTQYNAFMVHHIRQHIKQRASCDKCGVQLAAQQAGHLCHASIVQDESQTEVESRKEEKEKELSLEEETHVVAMDISNGTKTDAAPIISIEQNLQSPSCAENENMQLIRLANDDIQLQGIMTGDAGRPGEPVYVRVLQQVDVDGVESHSIAETEHGSTMMVKVNESSGKQMLTLAEDGSLQMVEVSCWDDVHPPDPDPDTPF